MQTDWKAITAIFVCIFVVPLVIVAHLLVAFEHRRRDKGLLAQIALVFLVSVVHHLDVNVESVFSLERGVALVALERPLTCSTDRRLLKKKKKMEKGSHFQPFCQPFVGAVKTRSSRTARVDPI